MQEHPKSLSIRPFIGCRDFSMSKAFYEELGYQEIPLGAKMSFIKINDHLGFYLQDYYLKDWIDNTMLFIEVNDLAAYRIQLLGKTALWKSTGARISEIVYNDWGAEFFVHDPAGVLIHYGYFNPS